MKNNYRIIFMGTPDFALPSLKMLCDEGLAPVAVYTQPDKVNGRGKKIIFSPVKTFALEHHIPVYQPLTLKTQEAQEEIRQLNPDLIIVIAYGKILPQAVLDIPRYGAVNVHASILPKYRGAAPVQRVIIDGEKKTGVTIMRLDAGMDTGNIVSIREFPIPAHMTAGELFDSLSEIGADELKSVMSNLPEALANSKIQNHAEATYAEKVTKEMGHIDWTKPAAEIDCLIRGMYPNPGTYTFYHGKRLKIHSAFAEMKESGKEPGTIISVEGGMISAACGHGLICITEIQPENHKKMKASDFINGHQVKANDKFDA